jgi:hypothetical protein
MAECTSTLSTAYLKDGAEALREVGIVDEVANEAEKQRLQREYKLRPLSRAQFPRRLPSRKFK